MKNYRRIYDKIHQNIKFIFSVLNFINIYNFVHILQAAILIHFLFLLSINWSKFIGSNINNAWNK